jgi:tetratricopeptide (TPR) repeat protein
MTSSKISPEARQDVHKAANGSAQSADPEQVAGWALINSHRRSDWVEAQRVFEGVLTKTPSSLGGLQGKTASLRKQRRFDEAARFLEHALQIHPAAIGLLAERAWSEVDQHHDDAAIEALDVLIASGNADIGHHRSKIGALRRQRRFEAARLALADARRAMRSDESLALDVDHAWLSFHEKRFVEALEAFDLILRREQDNASAWQGKIAAQRKLGRYLEAGQTAKVALAACKGAPGIWTEQGWTAFERRLYDDAESHFQQAVVLAPHDPQLRICVAAALIRQGGERALLAAEAACREALDLDENLAEAHGGLGNIAFKRGRLLDAERHLRRSTEIDPRAGSHADLGALQMQLGRTADAQESLRKALENDPDDSFAHVQYGSLLLQQEEHKQALREFRQAVALAPESPDAQEALAVGLAEIGRLQEAELTLRGALRQVDDDRRANLHLALCRLLTRMGDTTADARFYEEARKQVGLALARMPNEAAAHFCHGIVAFKQGDLRRARNGFREALNCDKTLLQAQLNYEQMGTLLKQETKLMRSSRAASYFLCAVLLAQLVGLWFLFMNGRISPTVFAALQPVLTGLLIVASVLPWLSRLKLTGLEAEIAIPNAKDALAVGPRGDINFPDMDLHVKGTAH